MKKLILMLLVAAYFLNASAQCTPDPGLTGSGITPKTLADGKVGVAYNQVITFQFPSDTTIIIFGNPTTVHIDTVTIQSIQGFPASYTKTCNVSNCTYSTAPLKGCVQIAGTPTIADTGTKKLKITVIAKGKLAGNEVPIPVTDSSVTYTVRDASGMSRGQVPSAFSIEQVSPNPFSSKPVVTIMSPKSEQITLQIHDILGKLVYEEKVNCKPGINNYTLNADDLKPGCYLFSVSSSAGVKTRKITKR
jgi:hypothetical protein